MKHWRYYKSLFEECLLIVFAEEYYPDDNEYVSITREEHDKIMMLEDAIKNPEKYIITEEEIDVSKIVKRYEDDE